MNNMEKWMKKICSFFCKKNAQRQLCSSVKKECIVMLDVNHRSDGDFLTVFPD